MAGAAQRTTARKASGEHDHMQCNTCGRAMRCPRCDGAIGGRKGGKAEVSKGFSSPVVRARAMQTRGLITLAVMQAIIAEHDRRIKAAAGLQ